MGGGIMRVLQPLEDSLGGGPVVTGQHHIAAGLQGHPGPLGGRAGGGRPLHIQIVGKDRPAKTQLPAQDILKPAGGGDGGTQLIDGAIAHV